MTDKIDAIRYPRRAADQRYTIVGPIGEGAFSQVFRATRSVALKYTLPGELRDMAARREAYALGRLSSEVPIYYDQNVVDIAAVAQSVQGKKTKRRRGPPVPPRAENIKSFPIPGCYDGIVCLLDYFFDPTYKDPRSPSSTAPSGAYVVALENIPGKSLYNFIETHGPLPPNALVYVTLDLLKSLQYMHSRGVLHNDIKGENVMLHNQLIAPVYIDFGFACTLEEGEHGCEFAGGTPDYMAPEVPSGHRTTASDLWALGVLIWELATGKPYEVTPFEDSIYTVVPQVKATGLDPIAEFGRFSPELKQQVKQQQYENTVQAVRRGVIPNLKMVQNPIIRNVLAGIFRLDTNERITSAQAIQQILQGLQGREGEIEEAALNELIRLDEKSQYRATKMEEDAGDENVGEGFQNLAELAHEAYQEEEEIPPHLLSPSFEPKRKKGKRKGSKMPRETEEHSAIMEMERGQAVP